MTHPRVEQAGPASGLAEGMWLAYTPTGELIKIFREPGDAYEAAIAADLRTRGYGPDDEEVVVDDLAAAAEAVGFKYDLNDPSDCAVLEGAQTLVKGDDCLWCGPDDTHRSSATGVCRYCGRKMEVSR